MELCSKDGIVPVLRVFAMKEIVTLGEKEKENRLKQSCF